MRSKFTVEDCPAHLSTVEFRTAGIFRANPGCFWTLSWPLSNGLSFGSVQVKFGSTWRGEFFVVSNHALAVNGFQKSKHCQLIDLTKTYPYFGGERFWFLCVCGRRVGRLYLTSEMVFLCRVCCDLTYQSAQEHNTRWEKMRPFFEGYACF
jgi:hypothetical protein